MKSFIIFCREENEDKLSKKEFKAVRRFADGKGSDRLEVRGYHLASRVASKAHHRTHDTHIHPTTHEVHKAAANLIKNRLNNAQRQKKKGMSISAKSGAGYGRHPKVDQAWQQNVPHPEETSESILEKVEKLDLGGGEPLRVTHIHSADQLRKHVGNTSSGATRTISYSNGKTVAWDAYQANHAEVSHALHGNKYNPDNTHHGHHEMDGKNMVSRTTYNGGKKGKPLEHHLYSNARRMNVGTDGKGKSIHQPKLNFPHDHANMFHHESKGDE